MQKKNKHKKKQHLMHRAKNVAVDLLTVSSLKLAIDVIITIDLKPNSNAKNSSTNRHYHNKPSYAYVNILLFVVEQPLTSWHFYGSTECDQAIKAKPPLYVYTCAHAL